MVYGFGTENDMIIVETCHGASLQTKPKEYEKLPQIPKQKQTLYRRGGGGAERVSRVCHHQLLLRDAAICRAA